MRVFYHCYDTVQPSGGQKHTYEHVDVLSRNGYDAYVYHQREGFRLRWFDNDTPVVGHAQFKKLYDESRDYIVLPEDLGGKILDYPGKKVIFDKNIYYGFRALGWKTPAYPGLQPGVVAILAVSEHNAAHLRFAYPAQRIFRVTFKLDEEIFRFRPLAQKKRRIACSTKNPMFTQTLFHMLQARAAAGLNRLAEYEWVMLDAMTEAELAAALQDSLLLIFLSATEGLGRVPLEGLACGCILAAFASGPLRETLPPIYHVEEGDVLALARRIESVTSGFPDELPFTQEQVLEARGMALRYSRAAQERSVLSAWEQIVRG
jgi:hypothetical protein